MINYNKKKYKVIKDDKKQCKQREPLIGRHRGHDC